MNLNTNAIPLGTQVPKSKNRKNVLISLSATEQPKTVIIPYINSKGERKTITCTPPAHAVVKASAASRPPKVLTARAKKKKARAKARAITRRKTRTDEKAQSEKKATVVEKNPFVQAPRKKSPHGRFAKGPDAGSKGFTRKRTTASVLFPVRPTPDPRPIQLVSPNDIITGRYSQTYDLYRGMHIGSDGQINFHPAMINDTPGGHLLVSVLRRLHDVCMRLRFIPRDARYKGTKKYNMPYSVRNTHVDFYEISWILQVHLFRLHESGRGFIRVHPMYGVYYTDKHTLIWLVGIVVPLTSMTGINTRWAVEKISNILLNEW